MLMKRLGKNRHGVEFAAVVSDHKEFRGPKIAFYDVSRGVPGQMVSRYYLSTLQKSFAKRPDEGLNLEGSVPVWELSQAQLQIALAWAWEYS